MNNNAIVRITEENPVYTSMTVTTRDEQKAFFNAVQNPTKTIAECINTVIQFVNVYMERIEVRDEDTGESHFAVKTVFICPDGTSIISPTSAGVARSLTALFQIFGTPDTWEGEVMEVRVKQVSTKNGHTYKLEVC